MGWCTSERRSLSRDTFWSMVVMGAPSWVLDSDSRLVVGCRFSADRAGDEGLSCERNESNKEKVRAAEKVFTEMHKLFFN